MRGGCGVGGGGGRAATILTPTEDSSLCNRTYRGSIAADVITSFAG